MNEVKFLIIINRINVRLSTSLVVDKGLGAKMLTRKVSLIQVHYIRSMVNLKAIEIQVVDIYKIKDDYIQKAIYKWKIS